ncbi:cobalt-zinc-cadmium efflux system protein [Scopulibacillus darangshiensis]|uniref:Cobalt-zinc-cadmium efflux system protein n=1 Tax=Scopulibacillus darangshiensis TaxID=442528 RepID=A0A4R2P432_9BACL|nr:cation diffusion facilitator family transporter [Scopulibacillus darangshiensis]TCP28898.1 cobalt-zinc-cadmium efflux system protein [Scopulibacillus darangshiensis]
MNANEEEQLKGNDHKHNHNDVFHSHAPAGKMKKAFLLTILILAAEIIGGIISNSLALLSDAGHVVTDLGAIGLSWFALKQADKPADEKRTFGYHRSGILAAFINGVTLIVITLVILWEAYQRFQTPHPIHSTWMFIGAGVGLIVNLYLGLGMRKEENLNVKSAVLHILGDAAASAGVIVGGIILYFTGWYYIDPILSVGIALLIAFSAWRIVTQTIGILMEGTPENVNIEEVTDAIQSVSGVENVHDLHVWSITSGKTALSCHLVLEGSMSVSDSQGILRKVEEKLKDLTIGHTTIQIEDQSHPHEENIICDDLTPSNT